MAELAPEKPDIIEDSDDGEWEVQLGRLRCLWALFILLFPILVCS